MKKAKYLIFGLVALLASVSMNLRMAAPANAECVGIDVDMNSKNSEGKYSYSTKRHFLGLRAWYDDLDFEVFENDKGEIECYVKELNPNDPRITDFEGEMRKRVWTIIFNVTSMLTGILGYLAIGFVIYGGFQYMLSRGNPAGTASGIKTITNALIGLAICCSASIISGAVADIITRAKNSGSDVAFVQSLFNSAFMWAGIIAMILIVYNGFQYITSAGNAQKVATAKRGLMASIIGLIIVLSAAAIVNVVVGAMN